MKVDIIVLLYHKPPKIVTVLGVGDQGEDIDVSRDIQIVPRAQGKGVILVITLLENSRLRMGTGIPHGINLIDDKFSIIKFQFEMMWNYL